MSDNPHPERTGEHLAHDCLHAAGEDYTQERDLVLAGGDRQRRDDACEVLAPWATIAPIAYDNEPCFCL